MSLANVNGQVLTRLFLSVGAFGAWFADCTFDGPAESVTGRVTLKVDGLELVGTVASGGVYLATKTVRIVGGGGAWGSMLAPKGYHNDAGIKALNVAQDAAREAGEVLGSFLPESDRVGIDYVRQRGFASRALEDVIGSATWWVDYAGVTHVGERSSAEIAPDAYEVLNYDPRAKMVTLSLTDLSRIAVGSVVSKTLDEPLTVRDFDAILEDETFLVHAWCGPALRSSRLSALFGALVRSETDQVLHGLYRYRVIRMSVERVELQAVRKAAGLPDLLPVSMWPGVAGVHAELAPGAEVLVQFLEGERTQPVVTHFAGADGVGFVPASITLGGTSGAPVARQGDAVEVLLPPAIFTGTINGLPATGMLTFTSSTTLGTITGGSGKVGCA